MPGLLSSQIHEAPHYIPASPTQEKLDYADLPIIDFDLLTSTTHATEAERHIAFHSLARQIRDAMTTHGFLYIVNHGYSVSQIERIFDIADISFSQVSDYDKTNTYVAKMKQTGSYQGYKPRQYWHIEGGVRDQLEHYNINRDITKKPHPEALRPFLSEIEKFARFSHEQVLHPLLRLLAVGLELPEETLVNMHGFKNIGETYVRFMKYYPRSEEEETKTKNVWLKGHTDFGTITILYSQPVAALQILTKNGEWKWVKHIENALIINAGDALEFLSGGFYPATIHRVVQPPPDQRSHTRLGVFYFCMTDDDVVLEPLIASPVLQRVGVAKKFDETDEDGKKIRAPTMEEWRRGRTAAYGQSDLKLAAVNEKGLRVEEEIINGVLVKHYN